jgi:eukaryotic-like serine/threonine-protein kinase
MSLSEQLQKSLGDTYRIERELGGGGMSRVFVATETRFGRQVVIKVLTPELAAGLSAERFEREITVAAQLQHPHVVPVLSAGDAQGLPYYTMPFVQGESLRTRLARGPLSIADTLYILRDVAMALEYAHSRGLVHRDIKPDNVLLTGGSAVVTDFGIAKALSAARTGADHATLTQIGTSIGTPAYMSPEQAAGDPNVDHRADIYSFGCTAYELLTGQVTFANRTPQRMLAAHMTEAPKNVRELRLDCPAALADVVMRCLAKDPSARQQTAADLRAALEAATSGASTTMPALAAPGMLRKALLWYAVSFVAVAVFAKAVVVATGVPDWVFPGALVVMALGLPVLLLTGYVQRVARHVVTATPTLTPGGSTQAHSTMTNLAVKASPHMTWKRASRGGLYAIGAFAVLVAVVMALRAMGIGPAASLLAAGTLKRAPILVADFKAVGDTSLGSVVTEAVRSELTQSSAVTLLSPDQVTDALNRMRRPIGRVDLVLAREIAEREGVGAIVDGGVQQVGTSYILSLRLVSADSGRVLFSEQETAKDGSELIATIGSLTRKLRGRIGESLKTVRESQPLEVGTTASLPALRKYTEAVKARAVNDDRRAVALLKEAVALDTAFGIAYARMAAYADRFDQKLSQQAAQKAFDLRDRMSDVERVTTEASYYQYGPPDKRDTELAFRAAEERVTLEPGNWVAVHNLALAANGVGDLARSDSLLRRASAMVPRHSFPISNLISVVVQEGLPVEQVDSLTTELAARIENPTQKSQMLSSILWRKQLYDSALRVARAGCSAARREELLRSCAMANAGQARLRGQIRESERQVTAAMAHDVAQGSPHLALATAADAASAHALIIADRTSAARMLDSALARFPIAQMPVADRPYAQVGRAYALSGRMDRARPMVAELEKQVAPKVPDDRLDFDGYLARIALAAGQGREALRLLRDSRASCQPCTRYPYWRALNPHALLAQAHDLEGNADSALVHYEKYVERSRVTSVDTDVYLPATYKRIGELAEAKGEDAKAIAAYEHFVDLWKDADAELQPRVREVRARLAKLREREARRR